MHSRAVIKSDVSVRSVHGSKRKNMTLIFALEVAFLKHTQSSAISAGFNSRKYRFTGSFSSKISNVHVSQFVFMQ